MEWKWAQQVVLRVPLLLIQNTDLTAYNFEQFDSSSSNGLSVYKPTNFVSVDFSVCLFSQPVLDGHWGDLIIGCKFCCVLYIHCIIHIPVNTSSSSSVALQPGVGLGLLYIMPPGLSIPCSVSPFVYPHLSQVRGHVIQPSHFWSSSSSCCIQLSVHLFWNCGVLHSFYVTKPSYSLAFNEPHNVLPLNYNF